MTKKFHILLVILTLGFFATPTLTYACGTKSTKTEKVVTENAIIQIAVAQQIIVLLHYHFGLKQK